ncbi:MAG: aminodeoxychorismate synthase component I [Dehalococcoidales bacterium]|jgi:para-aminobenzoate synthetase component 1|nr:aminodeoxychorismate synthase component I [Dehalococcoidales bacterium]
MKRFPLIEEIIPSLTAPQSFELFRGQPLSFFLDSGMAPARLGRYSFMGSDPFLVLKSWGEEITLIRDGKKESRRGNPFDVAGELLACYSLDECPTGIPFTGGVVGYFSYDLCHFIEHLPAMAIDDLDLPECYLAFYDAVVVFDHWKGSTYLVASGFPEQDEVKRKRRAQEGLIKLKNRIAKKQVITEEAVLIPAAEDLALRSNFSHREYLKAVATAREYICAGDIFQVNLSQRFETSLNIPSYELYRRLRRINPAPFASYLNFDGVSVVGASPERFLKVRGDRVETRPIKGTRPRGKSPEEDRLLAEELLSSVKDKAENVMIVDLERNDIGRVCCCGTVQVTELAVLETYPTVFHLTSTVEGKLRPDKDRIDLLKAAFPGGSITGAPKVRAMEIIDELEPTRRSVYTGAIGYLDFSGEMDLNIVIRTFLIKGTKAYFQVGGGIVYDSEPETEYMETLDKARALIQALELSPRVAIEART